MGHSIATRRQAAGLRSQPALTWRVAGRDETLGVMPRIALTALDIARRLDREADAELGMGHVGAGERLAHRAADLRDDWST